LMVCLKKKCTINLNVPNDIYFIDPEFHGFWESACDELFVFGKVIVKA